MVFLLPDLSHEPEEIQREQIHRAMHSGFTFLIVAFTILVVCISLIVFSVVVR